MADAGGQPNQPAMPDMKPMWRMLIIMVLIFGLYWLDSSMGDVYQDGNRHFIGHALNYVFQFVDLDGQYPVVTLMLMGAIMIILTTVIRTLMTDTLQQQKNQSFSAAYNKELRQARMDNNLYKVKKLMDMQDVMMQKSMESSTSMMKSMPITMIIIVPIFLWVRYFAGVTLLEHGTRIISIPWAMINGTGGIDLMSIIWFMPAWVLVYSLVSIPLGQIIMRVVRYFQFKKRLAEIENSEPEEVA